MKPSAKSRTLSMFAGVRPGTSSAPPERETRSGFPERPGQPSLFGPLQLEIGDAARLARSAAFKAPETISPALARFDRDNPPAAEREPRGKPCPTAGCIARQEARLEKARAEVDAAEREDAAAAAALRLAAEAEAEAKRAQAEAKRLRVAAKEHSKRARAHERKARELAAKVKP